MGIVKQIDPGRYDIFADISEENLETLLTCAGAEIRACGLGEPLLKEESEKAKCALILEGSAEARNSEGSLIPLPEGTVFGKGFFEKEKKPYFTGVTAGQGCRLLVMNHDGMTVPCWFSCFFHACFIDNLEKVNQAQTRQIL